jgi:hypothetical protein
MEFVSLATELDTELDLVEIQDVTDAGKAIPGPCFESQSPHMVYSWKYGLFILDEAHAVQKHNGLHMAVCALRG